MAVKKQTAKPPTGRAVPPGPMAPAPGPTAGANGRSPVAPTGKRRTGTGLHTSPQEAKAAIEILEKYVQERAELAIDKARLSSAVDAIKLMDALKRFTEEVADRVKSPAEKAYDVIRFGVVPELMEQEDMTTVTVDDVGRCNIQDDISVKVNDKQALFEWLIKNEKEDIIQEQVNAQTLTAFIRQRLKDGKEIPGEEVLKVTPVVRAVITRK